MSRIKIKCGRRHIPSELQCVNLRDVRYSVCANGVVDLQLAGSIFIYDTHVVSAVIVGVLLDLVSVEVAKSTLAFASPERLVTSCAR